MNSWTTPEPPTLHAHLGAIMAGVRAMISDLRFRHPIVGPILILVWAYLHRPAQRLERLIARWQAGGVAPPRPRLAVVRSQPRLPRARLPTGYAWLVRLVQRTAQFGPQLEALVARPEMHALLAAAPQAGRILRPLFTMLGIRPFPPVLRRPGAPPPPPGPIMPRRKRPPPPVPAPLPDLDPPIMLSPLGFRFSFP